ncbi:transcriptional regulator opi1 [Pleosporales sp. CAS-2024a]
MQEEQPRPPPPAYAQHEPESFHLPSVPTHLPHAQPSTGRLPGIKSLDLPDATAVRHSPHSSIEWSPRTPFDGTQWGPLPSLHGATFPKAPEGLPRLPEDLGSPMDTASAWSVQDEKARREMSVNIEDPDVRQAAEALSGLGNPDFVRSPTARSLTLSAPSSTAEPEPLLSLLTSNHPWLGGTINGSISAYNTTKGYTPRFVQYGAELIERNIGSPMVNTVSSVGRRTGMEQNIRKYLGEQGRRPSDLEAGEDESSRKRQRRGNPCDHVMDMDDEASASRTRATSRCSFAESLPAYDDQRSPTYEETAGTPACANSKEQPEQQRPQHERRMPWSTQLIMTTSGLGVALSDSSLRSLKLCLGLLRSATTRIDTIMKSLKLVLEEYEVALRRQRQGDVEAPPLDAKTELNGTMAQMGLVDSDEDAQVRIIADRIKQYSSEIWTTLQSVVQSVSRYTGGALPQNASQVVRTQLLSVPQRWQLAGRRASGDGEQQGAQGEAVRGANRMLAFAKEGLDMMGQITTVVDGTVQSAETWLNRIGRRAPASQGGERLGLEGTEGEKTRVAMCNGGHGAEKR